MNKDGASACFDAAPKLKAAETNCLFLGCAVRDCVERLLSFLRGACSGSGGGGCQVRDGGVSGVVGGAGGGTEKGKINLSSSEFRPRIKTTQQGCTQSLCKTQQAVPLG